MPFHFSEHNSNLVTLGAFDPISREPNFKQCAVRVERTVFTIFEQQPQKSKAAGRDTEAE
jgi:assimilatory nitrate reductase catalytic subunit